MFKARDHRFVFVIDGKTLLDITAKQAALMAQMSGGENKTIVNVKTK